MKGLYLLVLAMLASLVTTFAILSWGNTTYTLSVILTSVSVLAWGLTIIAAVRRDN